MVICKYSEQKSSGLDQKDLAQKDLDKTVLDKTDLDKKDFDKKDLDTIEWAAKRQVSDGVLFTLIIQERPACDEKLSKVEL